MSRSKTESKGVLLFAENNSKVNYVQLAIVAATCIKNNLGKKTRVSLITNEFSLGWVKNKKLLDKLFDKIIIKPNDLTEDDDRATNTRLYRDTIYYTQKAQFLNQSRCSAYELSPYEETLLIDVDYFILNDSLNAVWGCDEDFLINNKALSLLHEPLAGQEFRLNPYGIRMYWATVIFFRKSLKAELIFGLVEHIKEHWDYYKYVYNFPGALFRNDFAFSIAIHMVNGFMEDEQMIKSLPNAEILTAIDKDQFIEFEDKSSVKLFVNDPKENWKFYVSKVKAVNVHCMNKFSVLHNYDKIMSVINE